MAQFATQCREANPEISEWSTPVPGSSESDFVYGEIVRSALEDIPLSDQTASLMMDDERGSVIKLDLSRLPEISIFPGQMGPLVDCKNTFMQRPEFPETYDSVMNQLMRNIAKCLEGCRTEVIMQPAPFRDACCDKVFPAPPFQFTSDVVKKMGRRLHCVPDPCVARINGVEVAFTGSEVVVHLSKNEWHRSPNQENQDRITRLNSHLLDQRSLYPLSPPAIPSSTEELTKLCSLRTAPHVVICSSLLAASIKNINNSIVANPGIMARGGSGTFLRCEFSTSVAQDASNLPDCSRFEIVKL
ncbi:DNA polymerase epsilon subunit B [Teladorsagia circumcincta]|uniref:DNA polymerase alpha subunit B n=1 Tax=Teladorsagia circumcincta TaxID=45464 RepID=A0A2G9URF5_TELCI|nr:DNA polymerase epsilon subunit B [Teladorsagia circumcincta]